MFKVAPFPVFILKMLLSPTFVGIPTIEALVTVVDVTYLVVAKAGAADIMSTIITIATIAAILLLNTTALLLLP